MPVARYFLFVGGVLLALLFGLNVFSPEQAVVASNAVPSVDKTDKTIVRIRSDQKLPERVVYDTSLTTIVPPKAATVEAAVMPPRRPPMSQRKPTSATRLPSSFLLRNPGSPNRRFSANARLRRSGRPLRCALHSSRSSSSAFLVARHLAQRLVGSAA